jgi:RNA polymerase sigma-70 factor (ECF subfamily)
VEGTLQVESPSDANALSRHSESRDSETLERERLFRELVASHRERAVRLAWRLVGGDDAAAEDVAQDAFLKAYRSLGRFRGEASLSTWFFRILVHQARDYRRWRAVRELWTGSEATSESPDPSPRPPGDPALRARIRAALDRLSQRQREAFVLVHLEGFTVRECAELLGKGTVKSHLQRALRSLRAELRDLREETGESV